MSLDAEVIRTGLLDMQVCVPSDWTDLQIAIFAERRNPCGTHSGWRVRKEGSELLAGAPERVECSHNPEHVHVMLDA